MFEICPYTIYVFVTLFLLIYFFYGRYKWLKWTKDDIALIIATSVRLPIFSPNQIGLVYFTVTWVKNKGLNIWPKTIYYVAQHEWNKLPLFIRKSINLSTVISSLKTYLLKSDFLAYSFFYTIKFYLDIYIILLLNIYG